MAIFRRESPPANGGVECRWGRQKSRFWANIWLYCVLWSVPAASAMQNTQNIVCWWWETTTKCMTRSLIVTSKTTLRSGKSEAYVTLIKESARVTLLLLPRDATQARSLLSRSVCPSVCPSRSWIKSKRIKISSKFFHHRIATPF